MCVCLLSGASKLMLAPFVLVFSLSDCALDAVALDPLTSFSTYVCLFIVAGLRPWIFAICAFCEMTLTTAAATDSAGKGRLFHIKCAWGSVMRKLVEVGGQMMPPTR